MLNDQPICPVNRQKTLNTLAQSSIFTNGDILSIFKGMTGGDAVNMGQRSEFKSKIEEIGETRDRRGRGPKLIGMDEIGHVW